MNLWDRIGNLQNLFSANTPDKKVPGVHNQYGKVPFGVSFDTSKGLPRNANSYWSYMDTAKKDLSNQGFGLPGVSQGGAAVTGAEGFRQGAIEAGTFVMTPLATGIEKIDEKTNGNFSKALSAGAKSVRSNYAYMSDVYKHDAALGILSGLTMVVGGVAGAAVGGVVGLLGGPVGFAAGVTGGFALGADVAGIAERRISETGVLGKQLEKSARLAGSAVGQEQYNFGNDVTRLASKLSGWETLGDTSQGWGAITSGLINFGTEIALAPDIKAVGTAGKIARGAAVGGVEVPLSGVASKMIMKTPAGIKVQAEALAKDIQLLKDAGNGVKNRYTPVFEFYKKSDLNTLMERPEFKNNEFGQIGATLVAGKTDAEISLVLRVGRGDASAIAELQAKHPSTFAQYLRAEGKLERFDQLYGSKSGVPKTQLINGVKIKDARKILEDEVKDIRAKNKTLDDLLNLDSAFRDRTVSASSFIEKVRNDLATQRAVNKLEGGTKDITLRETKVGNIVQKVYQENPLSPVIVFFERNLDDAPHQTVNFNEPGEAFTRVRSTLRESIKKDVVPEVEARALNEEFLAARTEAEKMAATEKITKTIFDRVGQKYNVPSKLRDYVVEEYLGLTRQSRALARERVAAKQAYSIHPQTGDVIRDPQLLTQLSNGTYLPDVALVDKAFKRFSKKMGADISLPTEVGMIGKTILDEFNSIWRTFTLLRGGFPQNIMRDSTLRAAGDGALFFMAKNLSEDAIYGIVNSGTTVRKASAWAKGVVNKDKNLSNVRTRLKTNVAALEFAEKTLKKFKYDPAKPPKKINPELRTALDYRDKVKRATDELRQIENNLIAGIKEPRVGRKKTITISGTEFPSALDGGRYAEISWNKLSGHDDIRGLVASTRELEMKHVRSDRNGGKVLKAVDNEDRHLQAWENTLNDQLRYEPLAREIMSRNIKGLTPKQIEKEVVAWIKSPASKDLVERFGYVKDLKRKLAYSDAKYIYERVRDTIIHAAPDVKLQQLIMEDKVNLLSLKKMYPDVTKRPDIISDLVNDGLAKSNWARSTSDFLKEQVTWLATQPTSRLSYNPYFKAQYEHKLQNLVAGANAQGRNLEGLQGQFEKVARAYAMKQYRNKINAFNRDANYTGIIDYTLAFFPALVEQYRAYGKITLENPDFPMKILAMQTMPDYIGDVQTDSYGNSYVEVGLPVLGINGRLPTSWFNPLNPTGGNLISTGPVGTAAVNEFARRGGHVSKTVEDLFLPFGVQSNSLASLTPNTVRQTLRLVQAKVLKSGEQYGKDTNLFYEMKFADFQDEHNRQPTANEVDVLVNEAKKDALTLSFVRALGSLTLASQPRYVSPLQKHADIFTQYQNDYGAQAGTEKFIQDYPDLYFLADSLTNSTSGIRPTETAVALVKENGDTIERIVANLGPNGKLTALGAVFNDENNNFPSAATAYLSTHAIPGTKKKFRDQADVLANASSTIVNKGWRDWSNMVQIVTEELQNNKIDPGSGYGASILDRYKKAFIEQQKTDNAMWYDVKTSPEFGASQNDTITALSIAANTPKLWEKLGTQQKWQTITEYLNLRYAVYDELKRRGATYESSKAWDLRDKVNAYVANARRTDINFGTFYDRYFDGDTFDFVPRDEAIGIK